MILTLIAAALQAASPAKSPPILLGPAPDKPASSKSTAAVPVTVLQPSTPWSSFDEGYRCTVERRFGHARETVAFKFGLTAFPEEPGDAYLILRGSNFRPAREVTLSFDGGAPPVKFSALKLQAKQDDTVLLRLEPESGVFWASFRRSKTMTIAVNRDRSVTLAIPGAGLVTTAAEDCARKQFARFGGPSDQANENLARVMREPRPKWVEPIGPADGWIRSDDYPAQAVADDISAQTFIAFNIGPNGRAQDCRAIGSSRNLALDQVGCTAMVGRARFKPPVGPDGKPHKLVGAMRIIWKSPNSGTVLSDPFIDDFVSGGQPGCKID